MKDLQMHINHKIQSLFTLQKYSLVKTNAVHFIITILSRTFFNFFVLIIIVQVSLSCCKDARLHLFP